MNFWVTVKKSNKRGKEKAKCISRAPLGKTSCTVAWGLYLYIYIYIYICILISSREEDNKPKIKDNCEKKHVRHLHVWLYESHNNNSFPYKNNIKHDGWLTTLSFQLFINLFVTRFNIWGTSQLGNLFLFEWEMLRLEHFHNKL